MSTSTLATTVGASLEVARCCAKSQLCIELLLPLLLLHSQCVSRVTLLSLFLSSTYSLIYSLSLKRKKLNILKESDNCSTTHNRSTTILHLHPHIHLHCHPIVNTPS